MKPVGILFIFCLCLFSQLLAQQHRNEKNNQPESIYDINDPRNPNCPCHKLQQQAEEVYRQHIQQQRAPQQLYAQVQDRQRSHPDLQNMPALPVRIEKSEQYAVQAVKQAEPIPAKETAGKAVPAIRAENQKIKVKNIHGRKNLKLKPLRNKGKSASLKHARKRVVCFVWK